MKWLTGCRTNSLERSDIFALIIIEAVLIQMPVNGKISDFFVLPDYIAFYAEDSIILHLVSEARSDFDVANVSLGPCCQGYCAEYT